MFQFRVLKSPAEFIVARNVFDVRIETERLQHACVYTERNGGIALLDTT